MYIKLDEDKYATISDDLSKSSIISRDSIQKEVDIATQQIADLPESLTDEELLAWARENYTDPNQRNREVLQKTIDDNTAILSALDNKSIDASAEIAIKVKP